MARPISAVLLACGLSAALGKLEPYTASLGEKLWQQATDAVDGLESGAYEENQAAVCGGGTWGDSGQVDQWDQGRSPCWPSTMTISASWDTALMARWSVELAEEFGKPGRGQLGPGINLARFPWNGRLGEYMSGEDPYLGAQMVAAQVSAYRTVENPPLQVVKHFIPNTIENHRTDMIEVVDERTLFEVYYPPFEAAVNAGVSSVMCSYNAVKCTTGVCSGTPAYACANDDVLNKHLKDIIGFKGIVMSDWDATHCRGDAGKTEGCEPGSYINNEVAAKGGLDLEMPSCMTFSGGVSHRAKEKAIRMKWAYLVQGRDNARRLSATNVSEAPKRSLRSKDSDGWCCWWPDSGADICGRCQSKSMNEKHDKCIKTGTWCTGTTSSPPAPAPATSAAPAPAPDWTSGVYEDNPFGDAKAVVDVPAHHSASLSTQAVPDVDALTDDFCEDLGSDNVKSPCKLALADKVIVESTVVLKNEGDVLPLTKEKKVALIGKEACASNPLAIGGGSGWNGPSCNSVPKINVKKGIEGLKTGPGSLACPDGADGGNSAAADADVIVAVVVPTKASEGTDRDTLQLHAADVALIKKYSALGKPLVVAMNAPGPMITNTWDKKVAAMIVSWLPGQQNGRGIAMALYNEGYEASGRLPFTFPLCRTEECTEEDEFASVHLGDKIKNHDYYNFEEKALIGYRWYHAKNLKVNYPFGFGLFAYGSAKVQYTEASAVVNPSTGMVAVSCRMRHAGPRKGKEVVQMYLSFPDTVPGDAASKPEWVLKGFAKWELEANMSQIATFALSVRDLSYWDDAPGMSQWVCAQGNFRVCIGANAQDAINGNGACTKFMAACPSSAVRPAAAASAADGVVDVLASAIMKKDDSAASQDAGDAAARSDIGHTLGTNARALLAYGCVAAGVLSVVFAVAAVRALSKRAQPRAADEARPLVAVPALLSAAEEEAAEA